MLNPFESPFAESIYQQKYRKDREDWGGTVQRVVGAVAADDQCAEPIRAHMTDRRFIPAGRYLYSAGRPYHQVNNCFLYRAEDSREGWGKLCQEATLALCSGGGIGIDYSSVRPEYSIIRRTGGSATGPVALMRMINEIGRNVMQGGSRRSAIWAGLGWRHGDIFRFLVLKDWHEGLRSLKEQGGAGFEPYMFPLDMELTNISVIYDTEFFEAYDDPRHKQHELAHRVWLANVEQAFKTAEPGMSFNFVNPRESLRNAPVAGGTRVLTRDGYRAVIDIVGKPTTVWTGERWASGVVFKETNPDSALVRVRMSNGRNIVCSPEHPFLARLGKLSCSPVTRPAATDLEPGTKLCVDLPQEGFEENPLAYAYGHVYGDGYVSKEGYVQLQAFVPEKEDCVAAAKAALPVRVPTKAQMLSDVQPRDYASFLAGWFDADGCYTRQLLRLSCSNVGALYRAQEMCDSIGIQSIVRLDGRKSGYSDSPGYILLVVAGSLRRFAEVVPTKRIKVELPTDWAPYRQSNVKVVSVERLAIRAPVYCADVRHEEHSFLAEGVLISNCTEVVSEDNGDKCNLGTVWFNHISDWRALRDVVTHATRFLMLGGQYTDHPSELTEEVGCRNNRIGLGLGGLHEWLMQRGSRYECTPALREWLKIYRDVSDEVAYRTARELGVPVPRGVRAVAPTGTIGILAETTTGIEPLFCKAYKRRYFDAVEKVWKYQYVVDGAVKRLQRRGVDLSVIEDSYDIDFERRVAFQADVQDYVDMAISSTCNLPPWGSETNNESTVAANAATLYKYAKGLRGFTCYPDGARGGQPLTRVDIREALAHEGTVFEERLDECVGGVCGT